MDVQAELFRKSSHTRTVRRLKRQDSCLHPKKCAVKPVRSSSPGLLRQNLLGQAVTELNFQSLKPSALYTRWSDEFDAAEFAAPFWRWQS